MAGKDNIISAYEMFAKNGGLKHLHLAMPTLLPSPDMENIVCHDFPVLQVVISGVVPFWVADTSGRVSHFKLRVGDGYFSLPKGWNARTYDTERTMLQINFRKDRHQYALSHWQPKKRPCSLGAWREISASALTPSKHLLEAMERLAEMEVPQEDLLKAATSAGDSLLHLSRLELLTPQIYGGTRQHARWRQLVAYLEDSWHRPLQRTDLARELRITPDHVSRLFRQFSGESFSRYLTRLRIRHSKYLLSTGKWSVKEVANRCGFTDSSYFVKVFKRQMGYTPGQEGCSANFRS
ncbi:MAG: helix-turn-helix domain-containing protein [Planctomycetes bacterium]|nr:helix-turn-helix domain-containing protein [Planctomycetota bacterium]